MGDVQKDQGQQTGETNVQLRSIYSVEIKFEYYLNTLRKKGDAFYIYFIFRCMRAIPELDGFFFIRSSLFLNDKFILV